MTPTSYCVLICIFNEIILGYCLKCSNSADCCQETDIICCIYLKTQRACRTKGVQCISPPDPGPCTNMTKLFYFDIKYGSCRPFWYGGCGGNGNRFANESECNAVCVNPPIKDACNLPMVHGGCKGNNLRWFYDATIESCMLFSYGGCLGNSNNFESRELCEKQCNPRHEETKDRVMIGVAAGVGSSALVLLTLILVYLKVKASSRRLQESPSTSRPRLALPVSYQTEEPTYRYDESIGQQENDYSVVYDHTRWYKKAIAKSKNPPYANVQ